MYREIMHAHSIARTYIETPKLGSRLQSALLGFLSLLLAQHTPLCVLYTWF